MQVKNFVYFSCTQTLLSTRMFSISCAFAIAFGHQFSNNVNNILLSFCYTFSSVRRCGVAYLLHTHYICAMLTRRMCTSTYIYYIDTYNISHFCFVALQFLSFCAILFALYCGAQLPRREITIKVFLFIYLIFFFVFLLRARP